MESRIKRGIAWLDKKMGRKNWSEKIDLDELNLVSPSTCMIGETMENYCNYPYSDKDAEKKGFYIINAGVNDYSILTSLWKAALIRLGIGIE